MLVNGTNPTGNPSTPVNATISLPLGTSWSASTAPLTNVAKPAPLLNSHNIWAFPSDNSFYIWGGETGYAATPPPDRLWRFTADGSGSGTWRSEQRTGGTDIKRTTLANFAASPDTAYILGGYTFGWVDATITGLPSGYYSAQPGLVSWNRTSNTWSNVSTTELTPPFGTVIDGVLEFVPPFVNNSQGILVPLAGHILELSPTTSTPVNLRELGNVTVYDVARKRWVSQATTGEIPGPRTALCSVGVRDDKTDSYEM